MSLSKVDTFQPTCVPASFSHGGIHKVDLPQGFPRRLDSEMAWTNEDILAEPARVVHQLTPEEVTELENALARFRGTTTSIEITVLCADRHRLDRASL